MLGYERSCFEDQTTRILGVLRKIIQSRKLHTARGHIMQKSEVIGNKETITGSGSCSFFRPLEMQQRDLSCHQSSLLNNFLVSAVEREQRTRLRLSFSHPHSACYPPRGRNSHPHSACHPPRGRNLNDLFTRLVIDGAEVQAPSMAGSESVRRRSGPFVRD